MFAIINNKKQYATRKGIDNYITWTDNINFAYVYKEKSEAEKLYNYLYDDESEIKIIEI